ncbi:iron chelate uptake ABC transporter family permease subunit [Martelella alba]|uniref:Iron chelate uptake ABC transporter family permease subunit n=1 Tax=Martelella alba TaxID=2590451 RepID=A0A506U4R6_9HYPH|nr:iron chelate uptake ABC transporter family permease subunit [Martelella alba]TPW28820.1 iron chelate uptake ABC transporter family permease subunit [Martelella alba]
MPADIRRLRAIVTLSLLGAATLIAIALFMTLGAKGSWSFVLAFRGEKLAALLLVAYAIAVSTVLFQTVVANRILTPAIMGFDALYVLLQTVLVFLFGAAGFSTLDPNLLFLIETATMLIFSLLLFRFLFAGTRRSLHLVMLVGILFGGLFRSLASFLQRLIEPTDFMVLQDQFFASFNGVDGSLLGISAIAILAASLIAFRLLPELDILLTGRETAISLGVAHDRVVTTTLIVVTILVSVSTALVGPVTFFGLLVANLAYIILPGGRHRLVLPAAVLIAALTLVGGQTLLERVFDFNSALSIIIEFAGGIVFILLLLKGVAR